MEEVFQEEYDWINLVKLIRDKFGDDNLHFTFTPIADDQIRKEYFSTFADDNLDEFPYWGSLMYAKLFSGDIDGIVITLRIILEDKITVYIKRQKKLIPKKELYHIFVTSEKIILFDEDETNQNYNTDSKTGKPLQPKSDIVIKSSIDLFEQVVLVD